MSARSSVTASQGALFVAPAAGRTAADAYAAVRVWLWCITLLVLMMVVVGGATRLTGSGLSITEWRPFMGAVPPLTEAAWIAEFEKYRAIPQYQLLNKGMSLGEFKFIYWWEWGHRQLGRFIGFAFFLPWLWFVARGVVRGPLALWLACIGALGGFQAAIGWVMVASGLKEGMVAVAPVKLALHLTTACLILTCLVWTARALRPEAAPSAAAVSRASVRRARAIVLLVLVQIALGAIVAGSKSGLAYNTWPLMDGALVPPPSALFAATPWIANFVENSTLIQFNHRLTAYLLVGVAVWHWLAMRKAGEPSWKALHLLLAIGVQAALGVATLLLMVPLWAALLHQFLAALLLISAVMHAEGLGRSATASAT
jgi:heme a synthase